MSEPQRQPRPPTPKEAGAAERLTQGERPTIDTQRRAGQVVKK